MLIGNSVLLRSIEKKDLEQLRIWRNNPSLRSYFREYKEISKIDQKIWYKNIVLPKSSALMFSILEKSREKLIGACGLCYIDWLRKSADLSIYIGFNEIYLDDLYAVDAAKALISYGFNEIGLHRIWAEVYSHDLKKQKLFQELGFNLDGRFRESHRSEGVWRDSLYYSLLESDVKKF